MSAADIFISYSREDRPIARQFAEAFDEEQFDVWWDAALHSGETFDEVIEAELRAAKVVVVLWSPRSVTSRWVRAEATIADRAKKLIPVIIEPCDRPIIFELTHTADLSRWNGSTSDPLWREFVRDLQRMVTRADTGSIEPSSVRHPRKAGAGESHHSPAPAPIQAKVRSAVNDRRGSSVSRGDPRASRLRSNRHAEAQGTQYFTTSDDLIALQDEFHCLEIAVGGRLEKRFVVGPVGLKIGRTGPADVILADPRVSRTHCIVELAGQSLRVTDLDSTNGTYIDGARVSGSARLQVGSVLEVGGVSMTHVVRPSATS